MRRQRAFTLIELLVVIAIIALLMTVMMPALGKAKEMARMLVCSTNAKSLTMAALLWSEANNQYAIAGDWWKEVGDNEKESSILPYLDASRHKEKDAMACPTARTVEFFNQDPDYDTEGQNLTFTYGANGYLTYNISNLSPGTISGPDYYAMGSGRLYGPDDTYWTVRGATRISSVRSPYQIAYFIDNEYYCVAHWFFDPTKPLEEFEDNDKKQTRWHKKKSTEPYGIGMIGWLDGHTSPEPKDFAEVYTAGGETVKRWTDYYYGKKKK